GQRFAISSTIWVTNNARDYDGSIAGVVLLTNGVTYKQFTTNLSGYFVTNWTTSVAGFYRLQAVATDNDGLSTTSAPVTVIVTNTTASSNGPVASISNLSATNVMSHGVESLRAPIIREGLFDLQGTAADPDGDPVSYAVILFRPEDEDN